MKRLEQKHFSLCIRVPPPPYELRDTPKVPRLDERVFCGLSKRHLVGEDCAVRLVQGLKRVLLDGSSICNCSTPRFLRPICFLHSKRFVRIVDLCCHRGLWIVTPTSELFQTPWTEHNRTIRTGRECCCFKTGSALAFCSYQYCLGLQNDLSSLQGSAPSHHELPSTSISIDFPRKAVNIWQNFGTGK